MSAEQVIYDKRNQVVLATSRFYDRPFRIMDFDGVVVHKDEDMERTRAVHACTPIKAVLVIHILRRLPTPVAIAKAPGCTAWCRRGAG